MKSKKKEANVIIVINAMRKVISLFLGPFLTAYFIKKSQEGIIDISLYNIFSYMLLAIGSFIVASIIKNKFRIGMFRIGVILNFFYIMTIIILREKIINNLWLISLLYGISSSAYWFSHNLFVINKIDNNIRTEFTVKNKNISSIIGVLFPIILGSIITVTNFELTAVIILIISAIQILLSFILTSDNEKELPKFDIIQTWKKLKDNNQIRKTLIVEFFIGMNVSDGALEILMTILIFNSFKTDMNLGIITSITTILSIVAVHLYGKIYKNKNDKKLITVSCVLPVLAVLILLVLRNNITLIVYNVCYVIFTALLQLTREIRLYNIADSTIVDRNNQCEFFAIREVILNIGRVVGYAMLLLAGLIGSQVSLSIVMILLTLSIPIMGYNITKIGKFER